MISPIVVEGKAAPFERVAICVIHEHMRELLRGQGASEQARIGFHTLERLGYAVDAVTHRLIQSPRVPMI
jgi:hypothetical protein